MVNKSYISHRRESGKEEIMRIPRYRAKELDSERVFEGFYFAMPETTYCFTDDYEKHPVKILHFLVIDRMTDWSLPNEPGLVPINPDTLEQIGHVHSTDKTFVPGEWIKTNKMTKEEVKECFIRR